MPEASLHEQVIGALESARPENGGIVVHADDPGRVLAYRPPAPGGGAYITVLGAEPFKPPDRHGHPACPRR